jgi:hypothetical protein
LSLSTCQTPPHPTSSDETIPINNSSTTDRLYVFCSGSLPHRISWRKNVCKQFLQPIAATHKQSLPSPSSSKHSLFLFSASY